MGYFTSQWLEYGKEVRMGEGEMNGLSNKQLLDQVFFTVILCCILSFENNQHIILLMGKI